MAFLYGSLEKKYILSDNIVHANFNVVVSLSPLWACSAALIYTVLQPIPTVIYMYSCSSAAAAKCSRTGPIYLHVYKQWEKTLGLQKFFRTPNKFKPSVVQINWCFTCVDSGVSTTLLPRC